MDLPEDTPAEWAMRRAGEKDLGRHPDTGENDSASTQGTVRGVSVQTESRSDPSTDETARSFELERFSQQRNRCSSFRDALAEACETLPFAFALIDPNAEVAFASEAFRDSFGAVQGHMLAGPAGGRRTGDAPGARLGDHDFGPALETRALTGGYALLTPKSTSASRAGASPGPSHQQRDALTGLPNRPMLRGQLEKALINAKAGSESALLLLDLDRFKAVNDTLGHPVGDKLLCRVVDRLRRIVPAGDILVRLGGDEFAVLQKSSSQPDAARALATRIVDLVGRSYLVDDHLINIGVSVGIAPLSSDGSDPDRLLTSADLALYAAKEAGRGTFRFFEQGMTLRAQARRTLENDLRKALALREFDVHYQPQLNLREGEVAGFEALVRWHHPVQGMVSPASFIPIAEETGLIVPIGEWVLRTACKEAMNWPDSLTIAVNLSPVQFAQAGLVASVVSALAASGLPARRLELEITEGVLLKETAGALKTLHQLKALGVRIAMDDFGTGYSSLSYLRAFPFDKVKIDQSFIRDMHTDRSCAAVISAVVGLGASLGITTTAEGVETEQQLERLRAEGCTDIQGYLISRPVPAEGIAAVLHARQAELSQNRIRQAEG